MAAQSVNIQIDKGTDFSHNFEMKNPDQSVFNLTGYSAVAKIRKFPEAVKQHSFTVGITSATGIIGLSMTVGVTTQLTNGRNFYDIIITSGVGTVTKAFEGSVIVNPSASV
tara:strand:+ start:218 stop:550 length:333 start_codon:yes stop_codon:yes gene_type:complete